MCVTASLATNCHACFHSCIVNFSQQQDTWSMDLVAQISHDVPRPVHVLYHALLSHAVTLLACILYEINMHCHQVYYSSYSNRHFHPDVRIRTKAVCSVLTQHVIVIMSQYVPSKVSFAGLLHNARGRKTPCADVPSQPGTASSYAKRPAIQPLGLWDRGGVPGLPSLHSTTSIPTSLC